MAQEITYNESEYVGLSTRSARLLEAIKAGQVGEENLPQAMDMLRRAQATMKAMETDRDSYKFRLGSEAMGVPAGTATGVIETVKGVAQLPGQIGRAFLAKTMPTPGMEAIDREIARLEEEAQKLRVSITPRTVQEPTIASAGPSLIGAGGGTGYRTYTPPAEATEVQRARLAELEKQIKPLRMLRNQRAEKYYQDITKATGAPQPLESISRVAGRLGEAYEKALDPETKQAVGYQLGKGVGQVGSVAALGPAALPTLGMSAAGSGMERARSEGATPGEAVAYGLGSGVIETATERFALPGRVVKYLQGAIKPRGAARTAVGAAVSEFFQEQGSYYGTTALEKATFNQDAEFDFVEGLKQGAYGAGTGGLVGGALGKLSTPASGGKDTLYTEADKRAAQRMREFAANKNSPLQEDDANAREAFDEFRQRRISDYESMRQADPELPGVLPQSVSRGRAETQQEFFLEGLADTLGTKIVWVNEPGDVSEQGGIGAYHRSKNIIFLVKGGADMAAQTKSVLMHELVHRRAAATGTDADIYDTIKSIDPEGLASVEALQPEARGNTEEASAYYTESISKWLDASLNDRNFDRVLVEDDDILDWAHDAAVGLYNKLSGSNLLTAEQKRINGALEEMGIESSTTISALDAKKKANAARALVDLLRELTDVGQYQAKRQAPELVQLVNDTQAKIEQFQQENPGKEAPAQYYDTLEKAVSALESLAIDRKGVRDIKAQVGSSFEKRRQSKIEGYQREVAALENEIADLSRQNPDAPIDSEYVQVVEELSQLSQASGGPALKLSDVAQQIIKQQAVKASESSLIDQVQALDEQIIEAVSQRKPGKGIPKDLFNKRRAAVKLAGGEGKYPGMSIQEIIGQVRSRKANAAKPAAAPTPQEAVTPAEAAVAPQAPDYLSAAELFEQRERQRRQPLKYTEADVQRIRERNRELLAEEGLQPGVVEREAPAQKPARQVVNRAEQRLAEREQLASQLAQEIAQNESRIRAAVEASRQQQTEEQRKSLVEGLKRLARERQDLKGKEKELRAEIAVSKKTKPKAVPKRKPQPKVEPKAEKVEKVEPTKAPAKAKAKEKDTGDFKFSRTRPSAAIGFAGGGTVSVALADKIDPQLAVEYSPEIAAVYNENSSTQALVESMENVDIKLFEGKEFAQFSPPCVASSAITVGRSVDRETETRLGKRVGEIIRKARNPVVVIENVPAYRGTEAFKAITEALNETGYTWDAHTYKAEEYGSPSKRSRMIVRAVLDGNLPPKPTPTHSSKPTVNQKPLVSWKSALGGMMNELPVEKGPMPSFIARSLEAKGIDPKAPGADYYIGGSQLYKWVPISPETEPSTTILASHAEVPRILTKDGTVLRVTPEALKRLMGFGDELRLPADKNLAKRIIGNGVPKQLTQAVVGPLLDRESGKADKEDFKFSKTSFHSPKPIEQSREIVKQNAARLRSVGIPGRIANYLNSKIQSTSLQGTFSWAFARALVNKQARQYALSREAQRLTIAGERVMPVDKTLEDVLATAPGRMAQHLRFLFKEEFSKIGEQLQRGKIMVDGNSVGRPSIGRFFQALGQPYRKQAQRDREIAEMVASGISQEDAERDFDEYRREHIKELEAQLAAAKDEVEIESLKKSISQIRDGKAFMSDEDAAALVEEALNGPAGAQYKAVMDSVEQINDYTLSVVEDTGLRSAAWVKTMRERYGPHYVPFKDFPDGMVAMAGHGDRIPAKIFHQYRGRETEASGVMEHLFSQASSVMHYAELNRSRNALFETLQGAEEVAETKRQFGETEKTPGVFSPTITDSKDVTKFFSTDTEEFANQPISVIRKAADDYATKNKTEKILFYRDGRPMWMVTKDVMLAKEIADADLITVGKIQKILGMITRWRSAVLTRYVPDFLVANPFRDILGLKVGLSLEYGEKFVSEHITFRKQVWAASILRKDPSQLTEEEARLLKEFRSSGAKMDWQMDKSFEQIARELNQMARAQNSIYTSEFVRSVVNAAEIAGDLSENATRFMVFAGMRRSGASKTRAAGAARRGTVDFTQRGTWAPWLNSMYVFMSVNMTSIARLIGLSLNPTATDVKTGRLLGMAGASAAKRIAMGVMPRLAVYGYIGALLADLMGGEDEETKLSNYSMIPPYQRTDFINIGTGSPSHITIPAPHGFRFFSGVGALVYNVQKGYITEQEFRSEVMRSLFSAFSPVAGSTPLQAVTPDVVKPVIESVENKNWRGSQVHPVRPPGVREEFSPSAYQAYERTPQHYRDIAEALNEASGGTRAKAGILDMFPSTAEAYGDFFLGSVLRTLERVGKVATKATDPDAKFGEDYTVDDIPILRVFVKTVNREEWARRTYQARSKEIQQALADEREAVKMEAASRANLLKERRAGVPERINAANEAYAEDLKEARELYVSRRGEREKKDFPLGGQMFTRAEAYKEFERRIEDLYDELKATSSLPEQKRIRQEISRLKTVFSVQLMRLNAAS